MGEWVGYVTPAEASGMHNMLKVKSRLAAGHHGEVVCRRPTRVEADSSS